MILCGGPVHEDLPTFEAHIAALRGQGDLDYKGIDDSPVPLPQPTGFHRVFWRYNGGRPDYKQNRIRWTGDSLRRLSALREEMRLFAIEGDYSHLFMVDSDQIVAPGTLDALLAAGKDVIAGLTWTKYKPWTKRTWPNAWGYETKPNHPAHTPPPSELLERIKAGGIHQVEVTGGNYLISKAVLPLVSFASRPDTASEDVSFALSAKEAGIPIFLHCDVEIEHRRRR